MYEAYFIILRLRTVQYGGENTDGAVNGDAYVGAAAYSGV